MVKEIEELKNFKSKKEINKYCYYNLKMLKEKYNDKKSFKSAIFVIIPLIFSILLGYLTNLIIFIFLAIGWIFYFMIFHKNKNLQEIISWAKDYEQSYQDEIEKQKRMVKEYERKCNKCGKIWHSLVSEEKGLQRQSLANAFVGIGNLGSSSGAFFSNKSLDIGNKLDNLKKCQKCGSQNYSEKITKFEKK